jgi:hypothetical protein
VLMQPGEQRGKIGCLAFDQIFGTEHVVTERLHTDKRRNAEYDPIFADKPDRNDRYGLLLR